MAIMKVKDANGNWVEIPALVGPKGADGTVSFEDLTEEQKASLKGDDGAPGANGQDGKSAYQIAVDNGFEGDEADWLVSLKGVPGENGQDGAPGAAGKDGSDYVITAADYGAIADIVITKLPNAEGVSY